MNDPERLIIASPDGRALLRAGLDMEPPPGAKDEVLRALELSLAATAVIAGVHAAASSIPSAAPSLPGSTGALPAAKVVATKLAIAKVLGIVGLSSVVIAGAALAGRSLRDDARPELTAVGPESDLSQTNVMSTGAPVAMLRDREVSVGSEPAGGSLPAHPRASSAKVAGASLTSAASEPPVRNARGEPASHAGGAALETEAAPERAGGNSTVPPPIESAPSPLEDESEAFARARNLMRNGDPSGAVRALDDMQARFNGGGLSEERASLYVEALAASGRTGLARKMADALIAAHPGSALADRVRGYATK